MSMVEAMTVCTSPPPLKRLRTEEFLSLRELFAPPRVSHTPPASPTSTATSQDNNGSNRAKNDPRSAPSTTMTASSSYTFRLDHRYDGGSSISNRSHSSGSVSDHGSNSNHHHEGDPPSSSRHEDSASSQQSRVLIFRSDRAGAIAKIIYSTSDNTIRCLECKESYRGYDFGGLLFSEAVRLLRRQRRQRRPHRTHDTINDNTTTTAAAAAVCTGNIRLYAEEDDRRHNKLVHFYQALGCSVKPNAKIRYLQTNDGICYRKVPMTLSLRPSLLQAYSNKHEREDFSNNQQQQRRQQQQSLLSLASSSSEPTLTNDDDDDLDNRDEESTIQWHQRHFLPVHLVGNRHGQRATVRCEGLTDTTNTPHHSDLGTIAGRHERWLLCGYKSSGSDNDDYGRLELHTTTGSALEVESAHGRCRLGTVAHSFQLLRSASFKDHHHQQTIVEGQSTTNNNGGCLIRSCEYGLYLAMQKSALVCVKCPVVWNILPDTFSLQCSSSDDENDEHDFQGGIDLDLSPGETNKRKRSRF